MHFFWQAVRNWIMPKSSHPTEAFHERNLRLITVLAFPALATVIIISHLDDLNLTNWLNGAPWYGSILLVSLAVARALDTGRIALAGRLTVLVAFTTPLDNSAAYWSPGTIMMVIFFSFLFFLILPNRTEIVIAVSLNIAIFAYIALTSPTPAPLSSHDVFSEPVPAVLITLLISLLFIGLGSYIRHDQYTRDAYILQLEQRHNRVLSQFLNNVSHDLKTPLTNLQMNLYLLQKNPTNLERRFSSLQNSVDHLENILNKVLEIVMLDSGIDFEPQRADLNLLVKTIYEQFHTQAQRKKQTLTLELPTAHLFAMIDVPRLEKAIGNIVENAILFTDKGGTIKIGLHQQADRLIITVTDNGIGIKPDQLPHIYERFYRGDPSRNTSSGKIGLGLSISKKIVETHQGRIEVDTRPGEGSTFRIILPA